MKNCCFLRKNLYEGIQVKDIPELMDILVEESTDTKKWITFFRCKKCGQKWEERFVECGHGEVPEVVKVGQ